jgi:hypothetical protein
MWAALKKFLTNLVYPDNMILLAVQSACFSRCLELRFYSMKQLCMELRYVLGIGCDGCLLEVVLPGIMRESLSVESFAHCLNLTKYS